MLVFWKKYINVLYFVNTGEKNFSLSGIWDHKPCFSEIS